MKRWQEKIYSEVYAKESTQQYTCYCGSGLLCAKTQNVSLHVSMVLLHIKSHLEYIYIYIKETQIKYLQNPTNLHVGEVWFLFDQTILFKSFVRCMFEYVSFNSDNPLSLPE